ncbi:OpgC domain-containing protein [Variovorax sp. LARHSF232]
MTEIRAPRRSWEIDALRGLMLVLMTLTHLPTRLTDPLGQPFGFVSAAEGFVLLSAYMAGLVYSRLAYREGIEAMEFAFWKRAFKVYLIQAAILFFLFTVITAVGLRIDQPAVKHLVSFYLVQPLEGFVFGLVLIYEPALLDILPMYIFFLLLSPWVLALGMRHGWLGVMAASALVWALAQYGLAEWLHAQAVRWLHLPVPYGDTGSFNTFAWQLLWMAGLWMGASRNAPDAQPFHFPRWLVVLAGALALYGLWWRHHGIHGQAPFGADVQHNLLFDKWLLGPLRVLNLVVLGILTIRFGPQLARWLPRQRWLETMGAASLPVFCTHLIAVLLVLAIWGDNQLARPWWGDVLLLGAVIGAMWGVGRFTQKADATPPPEEEPAPAADAA